ncbi:hypothetical protein J2X35_003082 [Mesorhizobium sp. BE184]|nr:hypothetical protein [Mesorhizobium sp. BE184]
MVPTVSCLKAVQRTVPQQFSDASVQAETETAEISLRRFKPIPIASAFGRSDLRAAFARRGRFRGRLGFLPRPARTPCPARRAVLGSIFIGLGLRRETGGAQNFHPRLRFFFDGRLGVVVLRRPLIAGVGIIAVGLIAARAIVIALAILIVAILAAIAIAITAITVAIVGIQRDFGRQFVDHRLRPATLRDGRTLAFAPGGAIVEIVPVFLAVIVEVVTVLLDVLDRDLRLGCRDDAVIVLGMLQVVFGHHTIA